MDPIDQNNQLITAIANLTAAISNTRLYSKDHPQIQRYINKAYATLSQALIQSKELTFIFIGEEMVLNNIPIRSSSPHLTQFRRLLKNNGIEYLTLLSGLTQAELENFIKNLASQVTKSIQSQNSIRLGKVGLYTQNDKAAASDFSLGSEYLDDPEQLETLARLQKLPVENLQELYHNIRKQKLIHISGIEDIVKNFIRGFSHGLRPMQMLASLKGSDQYTFSHVVNVCLLTMAQAEALGISGQKLFEVGIAAVLHDVGKLFIPEDILNKPSKLTEQEWQIMEGHTVSGARYILKLTDVPDLAILGALEHHIRYDGSGYPKINSSWKPHFISQMIAISDIYDAMRSHRPYQSPKPEEFVLNILTEEKGTVFNPFLVDNFLKLLHRTSLSIQSSYEHL